MSTLESLFGGSLAELAEKAGTRLIEVEQMIKNCEAKSENAIQVSQELKGKFDMIFSLFEKINDRLDVLENTIIPKITVRLDNLESTSKVSSNAHSKFETNTAQDSFEKNDCSYRKSKRQNEKDDKNHELLNQKIKKDKAYDSIRALRMLDELTEVSDSR